MALKKRIMVAGAGLLAIILLTMNTFSFMLLFWAFFAGVSAAVFALKPGYELPNLWPVTVSSTISRPKLRQSCSVCQLENCTRERPENNLESLQPWIGIELNERADKAVSEFLEQLLQKYVWNWYRNLSDDETFVYELKVTLRHCLAVLYRRVNRIDIAEVIIKKLLHVAVIHLHVCMSATKAGCTTEDEILMWYGAKIHSALKSRRSELSYIRALCDCIFPYLCPSSLVQSSVAKTFLRELLASNVILYGIDTIEDPDKVNQLLLIFFDKSPPKKADQPPSPMVPFLDKFAFKDTKSSNSLLFIELPKIMTTQDMLYQFMSFLKSVGAVHHLQFCLTVDDFNRRCLSQDQDEDQQVRLHKEAKEIYDTYCSPVSPTFIHFSSDVINELRDVSNGQPCAVNRLRASASLFRAYDHVYDLLERIYCPMFYQSDTYYKMVCGERRPAKPKKATLKQNSSMILERNGSAHSSPRKKKDLKDSVVGGFPDSVDVDQDENAIDDDDDEKSAHLLIEDEIEDDDVVNRDLSAWRIEIPTLELVRRDDPASRSSSNPNERLYAFRIAIKRVDVHPDDGDPEQWFVLRRYSEFYVLESKLMEFHGNLGRISLPPKKILGRNFEFLDAKRADFEKFLKALISQARLRHSELLFDFLYPDRGGAGSQFVTKLLPDVKLGRLFRRVPTKLLKEKGQHLSVFLQSFLQSCEPSKPKPGKYEPTTDNPEIQMDHKLHNELYPEGDWFFDSFQSATSIGKEEKAPFFTGVCDYLIFVAVEVFKADKWLHHVMVGAKKFFQPTIEPFAYRYLRAKIDTYRQEHHVVDIVRLFGDILFHSNHQPRTAEQKKERREETFQAWKEFIPDVFTYLIGSNRHEKGCERMFNILQQPKLNKQLGYMLLDTCLVELFPELLDSPPDSTS